MTIPTIRRAGLACAMACAAALAAAAPARAAYAPRLTLTVDPPTFAAPVAVTLGIAQDASEEATSSVHVTLPGFGSATGAPSRPPCTGVAASSGTCPADSRIGTASMSTGFGEFTGGVYFTGMEGDSAKVLAIVSNSQLPLALDQRFTGALTPVPGGRELAFDGLPGATATRLQIALAGDDRALVTAPRRCGNFDLVGRLTSHAGGSLDRPTQVSIGGCPGTPPAIFAASLNPRQLRVGATTTLAFTVAETAAVRVTARRIGTRAVRTLRRMTARPGRNRVPGLARGLAAGRWVVSLRAADADGAVVRTLALRILDRRR
ncbi:MAG: hypothetical protein QOI91_2861 [Solirubrobacteraceae bacterium]|nr:hypothetical protein [Solirubrobacteraceae bacterium]